MVEIQPFTFNFQGFRDILADEAQAVFGGIRDKWQADRIYACGLAAHSEEFASLYPLVFTQVHLENKIAAQRKQNRRRFAGMSRLNMGWYYRYRYHVNYDQDEILRDAFVKSNRLIAQGSASLLGMWIDAAGKLTMKHADDMMKPHLTRFRATCINVLRELKHTDMFGQDTVWMIDYFAYPDDDPAGRIIGALNPPNIVNRYRIEMAKASSFDMLVRRNQS